MPRTQRSNDIKLLPRFRLVGFFICLSVTCIYVLGAIFELPFLRAGFEVDPTVLGILGGITLILGGVEGISRYLAGFESPVIMPKDEDEAPK